MGQRDVGPEVGVVNPHPVQDHPDAPRQCDHGALPITAAGDLHRPCSQPCCSPTVHHDGRGLAHGTAQVNVASLRDAARDVAFA